MAKSYFLFAGEISGDFHGGKLLRELQFENQKDKFWGIGGPQMRKERFKCFIEMEKFQVMGFTDVIKALPKLCHFFYVIRNQILKCNPDVVILIDYPGFNLRLAASLRRNNYRGKIIQYIIPSIWAHGQKRIQALTQHYDLLLAIYPFEPHYFEKKPIQVHYLGNPVEENVRSHIYKNNWWKIFHLASNKNLVALFPGSRKGEILRHLEDQLNAAFELKQKYPELQFVICCAHENLREEILKFSSKSNLIIDKELFIISSNHSYNLMHDCVLALTKSGTVALELAMFSVPTVVHYKLSIFNYLIAKYFLKVDLPYYCIVNIIANQEIFPEFIGKKYSSEDLTKALAYLYADQKTNQELKKNCISIKNILGVHDTHKNAARAIQRVIL